MSANKTAPFVRTLSVSNSNSIRDLIRRANVRRCRQPRGLDLLQRPKGSGLRPCLRRGRSGDDSQAGPQDAKPVEIDGLGPGRLLGAGSALLVRMENKVLVLHLDVT